MTSRDRHTTFFRLLKTPIDAKGEALAAQIAALNATGQAEETYAHDSGNFSLIPTAPLAYWAPMGVLHIFQVLPPAEGNIGIFRRGAGTNDDFRFLRLAWEVAPAAVEQVWWLLAKGGPYSPYYHDVHLTIDWENEGSRLKEFCRERGYSPSRDIRSESLYFRPGLTWPNSTTSQMSTRVLPKDCIFGSMGPSAFVDSDAQTELMALLAVMNSTFYRFLVSFHLGLADAGRRHYEVGLVQKTPVPPLTQHEPRTTLAILTLEAHGLQRDRDRSDETTHAFCLPGLVMSHRDTEDTEKSQETLRALCASVADTSTQARLAAIQAEIDDLVFDLYGLSEADRALVRAEMGEELTIDDQRLTIDDSTSPSPPIVNPKSEIEDLLMWCVGVAFGRWDIRMALDSTLLPALQGPFDPLPRCAPGALVGTDGLPPSRAEEIAPEAWLRARKNVLDLPLTIDDLRLPESESSIVNRQSSIAWDGILVDDPTHPADLVARVRRVLALLWGDAAGSAGAGAIEREACEILGFKTLRDYFRDPRKGFFAFHIKRYSKSRRKAPIYWLLQSERRNYGVWLYYHRLDKATLYAAGRDYADAKVALEQTRLEELRQGLEGLGGSARRRREREIEGQQKLVVEVTDFRKRLDTVALLNLPPDLNDGVVISIAPLWELVPWKEAQKTWDKLVAGEYEWSTMAQQMRERGLV